MTLISLLMISVVAGLFYFVMELPLLVTFSSGLVLGWLLIFLDSNFFYRYYNEKGRSYKLILSVSLLLIVAYTLMTFYLFFTSFNLLGLGLMGGIDLVVSLYLLQYKSSTRSLDLILNVKNSLSRQEANLIVYGFNLMTVLYFCLIFVRFLLV